MHGIGNFKIENRYFAKEMIVMLQRIFFFCIITSDDNEVHSEACLLTPWRSLSKELDVSMDAVQIVRIAMYEDVHNLHLQGESSSWCWLTKGKQLCWGIPSWAQLYCQIYKNISTTLTLIVLMWRIGWAHNNASK